MTQCISCSYVWTLECTIENATGWYCSYWGAW